MSVWSPRSSIYLVFIFFLARARREITYVVKEESDNGTFIGNILIDSGLNGIVSTGGDVGIQLYEDQVTGLFRIDGNSGRLVVAGRIDRETICPQQGGISASNSFADHLLGGTDNSLNKCQVDFIAHIPPDHWINIAVIVEDINDHAPRFQHSDPNQFGGRITNPPYIIFISEGVSTGYEVPLTGATDEDTDSNGIQSYSLCGGDIENSTFALKFVLSEKNSYKGQLKVCDGGRPTPQCAYQNISIFITDINDNTPHFDQELYEVRISEATPVMTTIVAVTATDADSGDFGKLTYRFGQIYGHNSINFFGIKENTGEVWVKSPLDAKIMSHLKIPVIAQDGGTIPKTGTAMLQIDIEDVNNHLPWIEVKPISPPAGVKKSIDGYVQLWVEENQPIGTQIGIILTGDKDIGKNGEVACELKGNNMPFRLRYSGSGRERKMYSLQSKTRFDLEAMLPHTPIALQVECSDAGNPKIIARQNIQVNIVDSNLVVHLPEDAPPGSFVVNIQATDRDATPKMKFELVDMVGSTH
ncbi:Protocadherin-11 Y-linked [Echinococcus granulosus]|nr:Protocadherin-11 Y-linked [Echinococcus granulosus]